MNDLRTIRRLLVGIFILMAASTLYFARDLFLPIVIGVLVALTVSPLVRGADRVGIPAALSAFVLVAGATCLFVIGAWLLSAPISAVIDDVPEIGQQLRYKLAGLLNAIEDMQSATDQVEEMTGGAEQTPRVAIEQPGFVAFAAGNTARFFSLVLIGLVLAFFILASGDLFHVKLVEAFPTFSDKRRALKTVRDVERQISRYFLTITVINAGLGLSIGAAMYLVGMPNPALWGTLAFALNFLPFIGALLGGAVVAVFGVLSFDTLAAGLLPAVAYLVLTSIEGHFLTPSILGRRLELNTVSVLLTVVVWSWLWSIPGALMAVPFLVMLKVICNNVAGLKVLGSFLGARPAPDAPDPEEST